LFSKISIDDDGNTIKLDMFRSFSITKSKAEYGFLYYENNTDDITLRELVKFGELENLELMAPYSGDSVQVEVPPKSHEIVVLNRTQRGCSFNCTYFTSLIKPIHSQMDSLGRKQLCGRCFQLVHCDFNINNVGQ